jgi:hypothetical protein
MLAMVFLLPAGFAFVLFCLFKIFLILFVVG